MNKQKLIIIILGISIATGVAYKLKQSEQLISPPAQQEQYVQPPQNNPAPITPTFDDALNSIVESELTKNLAFLASDELEGRMSGKKGNLVAAEFIKNKYESFGLPTQYQRFRINRVNPGPKNETGDDYTQNIIAYIPGSERPNEIVVIGAHMDHIGYGPEMSMTPKRRQIHPGADDNASGTVALLEIAKAFSKLKPKRTVVFQTYSAEEMGLIGSRYYCDHPLFPIDAPDIKAHVFMLNFDMIGYLGKGKFSVGFNAGDSSAEVTKFIDELNQKYSFAKRITTQGRSGSDHASFYNKQIPVAFMHTGMHDAYHTPDDTPDKLNYQGIEQIAKYAFELSWKIANADSRPFFNYAGFQEMDYTHDHGHPGVEFFLHKYHKHD